MLFWPINSCGKNIFRQINTTLLNNIPVVLAEQRLVVAADRPTPSVCYLRSTDAAPSLFGLILHANITRLILHTFIFKIVLWLFDAGSLPAPVSMLVRKVLREAHTCPSVIFLFIRFMACWRQGCIRRFAVPVNFIWLCVTLISLFLVIFHILLRTNNLVENVLSASSAGVSIIKPVGLVSRRNWIHRIHGNSLKTDLICPSDSTLPLLIVVTSAIENIKLRLAIRTTWGKNGGLTTKWRTVFAIGEGSFLQMVRLANEVQFFGDIIHEGYTDSSPDGKVVKVISSLLWATKSCKFQYLLKCDDNVYINTPGLVKFLMAKDTPKEKLYTGNLMSNNPVLRSGRYGISSENHIERIYRDYCSGGAYVLSEDLVHQMIPRFNAVRRFNVDDAYIGRVLSLIAGVKAIGNSNFLMRETKCLYNPQALVQLPSNAECILKLFPQFERDRVRTVK